MIIEIICQNCGRSLEGKINQREEVEIELCPDCLEDEKKASFEEGYDEGFE